MSIFKDYTFKWWQIGLLKLTLLLFGIAIGASWQAAFLPYVTALVAFGIILSLYLIYISFKK